MPPKSRSRWPCRSFSLLLPCRSRCSFLHVKMHNLPRLFQGDAFALVHGQGMIGRLQFNPGTKVAVLEMSHRFEQGSAVLIIGDARAQPAGKRANGGSVGMLPLGKEILLFLR